MIKLLVVEDDTTSQRVLEKILSRYTVTITGSGEEALEVITTGNSLPDLITLDIDLPGIDGLETCRQLKKMERTADIPVIFLSSFTGLNDRLAAYGAGGSDYIKKPFDIKEMYARIDLHLDKIKEQMRQQEAQEQQIALLLDIQSSASHLQSVNRFLQIAHFCPDLTTLAKVFLTTGKEIGMDGVLNIHTPDFQLLLSTNDQINTLESDILSMSQRLAKIHQFGQERAVYNWPDASFLLRKTGKLIDTVALFMDALQAGIQSITLQTQLQHQLQNHEDCNQQARDAVTHLFSDFKEELESVITSLGLVSALDAEDEERLAELIYTYSERIDEELQRLYLNGKNINTLVNQLRTPPQELLALIHEALQEKEDDVLF
jgi:CheY-like chemotaxis protein